MLQRGNRNGQASLISLALYSAVIVVGISTVVVVGTPILNNMQDAQAVDAAKNILTGMEGQIQDVAGAGQGSHTTVGLRFAKGEFVFDSDRNTLTYQLQTDSNIISPHSSRQIGNLRLSSLAGVSITKSSVNGQPCWQLANAHISTCIRLVPQNTSELIGSDTVGYWRFNKNQGTIAYDNSSNADDGLIHGATWVDGREESGLQFDGEDDYVNISNAWNYPVSVSFWAYPKNLSGSFSLISSGFDYGADTGWELKYDQVNHLHACIGTTCANSFGDILMPDTWQHIVLTINNTGGIRVYRNGVLEGVQSATNSGIGSNTYIGAEDGTNLFLNGTIDEVRIYNRTLAPQEVKWLYKSQGLLNFIDTDSLILRYHNKDENKDLNAGFGIRLRTDQDVGFTNNGTGYVSPQLTGQDLGRGRVDAHVKSFFGIDYTVVFKLLSGADFLQVDVEE